MCEVQTDSRCPHCNRVNENSDVCRKCLINKSLSIKSAKSEQERDDGAVTKVIFSNDECFFTYPCGHLVDIHKGDTVTQKTFGAREIIERFWNVLGDEEKEHLKVYK